MTANSSPTRRIDLGDTRFAKPRERICLCI